MVAATESKKGKNFSKSSDFKKRKFDDHKKDNKSSLEEGQSASNKKRALKHERQSHRKHADIVVSGKELWNKMRLKSNTKEEITEMMTELMTSFTGKFNDVAMQHDASRIVQAAIQFGNEDQRLIIVKELSSSISELSKVQYAHFAILKMIKYCVRNKDAMKIIVKSLKGHINKLCVHAVGARVVELLLATFPAKITAHLKLELYGPQFALFASGDLSASTSTNNPTLQSIIKEQPDKKEVAVQNILNIINKGIEKSLFSFAYFQRLFSEYVLAVSPNEIRAIAPSISDHAIHLLSTRSGARVVAECAAYSTPKERKRMMRSLKGYTRSSLKHADAYIALLRLIDVTDDTVTAQKLLLEELQVDPTAGKVKVSVDGTVEDNGDNNSPKSPILEIALSDTGSKLFLMLLSKDEERRKKYFDPSELEILKPNPTVLENGEQIPTSKKNASTRRVELLRYMKNLLVELCTLHADELLFSRPGSKILREVFETFPSKELSESIIDVCKRKNTNKDSKELSIFEHPVAHLAIKNLILADAAREGDVKFSSTFFDTYGGSLMDVASSNRGAFVVAALATVKEIQDEVRSELLPNKRSIKKLARGVDTVKAQTAGYKALLNLLESK